MKKHNRFVTTMLTGTALLGLLSANAGAVKAVPSTHKLYVNNKPVEAAAYNIEGNNYFKLRDIARLVDFGVQYYPNGNSIEIVPKGTYKPEAGESTKTAALSSAEAKPSRPCMVVNGELFDSWGPKHFGDDAFDLAIYNINGNNYFKLRDLGRIVDFNVTFTAETSRVDIDTQKPYAAEKTTNTNAVTEEDLRAWELEMVDAVNEERRNAGLNELVIDEQLMGFSQYWAKHLTTDFSHSARHEIREYVKTTNLSEEEAEQRIVNVGENIGMNGSISDNPIERMMKMFMDSPGHKAAILREYYKTIGIGFAVNDKGEVYCCQNFGMVLYKD